MKARWVISYTLKVHTHAVLSAQIFQSLKHQTRTPFSLYFQISSWLFRFHDRLVSGFCPFVCLLVCSLAPGRTERSRQRGSGRRVIKISQPVNTALWFREKAFTHSYFNQNISLVYFSNLWGFLFLFAQSKNIVSLKIKRFWKQTFIFSPLYYSSRMII